MGRFNFTSEQFKNSCFTGKPFSHEGELVLSIWIIDSNLNKHERISETKINNNKKLILFVECDSKFLQFYWAYENEKLIPLCPKLDALILSDDYVGENHSGFTGAFVGMAASDKFPTGIFADFNYFKYNKI